MKVNQKTNPEQFVAKRPIVQKGEHDQVHCKQDILTQVEGEE
jgi:hypothetical protein